MASAAVAFFSVALFARASSIESFASYYLVISITNVIVFPVMQSVINKTDSENTKSDVLLTDIFITGIILYYLLNTEEVLANSSSSLIASY